MKKLILFLLIIITCALIGVSLMKTHSVQEAPDKSISPKQNASVESTTAISEDMSPGRLQIPDLGIDADIEYVGMDAKGNMDVPKRDENVAWFEPGFMPGKSGNAVLAGHYDKRNGSPAVFYKLDELEKGDSLFVVTRKGERMEFIVERKAVYPYDDFPLTEVFGSSDRPRLNLITCEGQYDSSKRIYSHRTVIYSTLK